MKYITQDLTEYKSLRNISFLLLSLCQERPIDELIVGSEFPLPLIWSVHNADKERRTHSGLTHSCPDRSLYISIMVSDARSFCTRSTYPNLGGYEIAMFGYMPTTNVYSRTYVPADRGRFFRR